MNDLNELRNDCALKQKRGIHFIITSVVIWAGIAAIHLSPMNIMAKKPFHLLPLRTPNAHDRCRVEDFKNRLPEQEQSADSFRHIFFCKSDSLSAYSHVGI